MRPAAEMPDTVLPIHHQRAVRQWLRLLAWAYFAVLFGWAVAHVMWGDRYWWLFAANALAPYLFLPLPAVLMIAIVVRRREIWLGTALALLLWAVLYGRLFLPWRTASASQGRLLTVMTYNTFGLNEHPDAVVETIQRVGADVVSLQELNPGVARAIKLALTTAYPYQQLDPRSGVTGSGVISRYPITPTGEHLPGDWVGSPQILRMDIGGRLLTILAAHPLATMPGSPAAMERTIVQREQQARAIRDFAVSHSGPLIAPIDLNSTDKNTAYDIVTSSLTDAWLETGWGFRHSFSWIGVPLWVARIDYVFHSRHFRAVKAWVGDADGSSDHRPVIAQLELVGD